jgi:endonuclease YncB( thermonuclease family)
VLQSRRKALQVGAFLVSALLFLAPAIGRVPAAAPAEVVQVRHAIDGDSLLLSDGRQVRLLGVNTPEMHPSSDKHRPPMPLAREAQRFTAARVDGRSVTLRFEQEHTDRHKRLLAHVTLSDGSNLEEALLREGLGWVVAIPPNVGELARLQTAEDVARAAGRGVWGKPEYLPAAAERLTTKDAGFLLLTGTVRKLGQSSYAFYFELAPRVTLLIPRDHWNKYFAVPTGLYARPQALVGRRIVARGWAHAHDGRLRLRVAHPAMLTLMN